MHGNRYGTLQQPVEDARAGGRDVLLELDVQGALEVQRRVPDAVLLFLVPSSLQELEARLRRRGTEDEAAVARRLARAREEMPLADDFDHVVVNDVLEEAVDRVVSIIEATDGGIP